MLNAFSIDLEEWFCVSNFEGVIQREDWPNLESRVVDSTVQLLDLLDRHSVKATFFILGWVAERHPDLIRSVAMRGHEIASHGFGHQLVYSLSPEEFEADMKQSLAVIKEITGADCKGYRAPSFSLRRDMDWAWSILRDHGIEYDSSIFPVVHDRYGEPDAPRFPFVMDEAFKEFPMSTVSGFGKNLPVAGGGYLRLYPYAVTRWAIRRINREGHPAVVYMHPWEVDPGQPRPAVSRLKLLRHRI
ncbi:MAG: XrtA system polysaccharide deacetylase, partial [Verrucomicrobiota bacterium]